MNTSNPVVQILSNLAIRTKLLLLVSFSTAAMAILFAVDIGRKLDSVDEMAELGRTADLTTGISSLVHELQKERGATALFLGSRGTRFKAPLRVQRTATDQRSAQLRDLVQLVEVAGTLVQHLLAIAMHPR